MNLLDSTLVFLSLVGALWLAYRVTRPRPSGGCHSSTPGKIPTGAPVPCAGCQSAVRTVKPGPVAR